MLEEFRLQADTLFFDEPEEEPAPSLPIPIERRRLFLGMTPAQRFVIVWMLFSLTFLLGSLFLLVTEKVAFPFLV